MEHCKRYHLYYGPAQARVTNHLDVVTIQSSRCFVATWLRYKTPFHIHRTSGQLKNRFPSPPHAPRCAPRPGLWALARRAAPAPTNPVEERSEEEPAQADTRAWHL